MEFEDLVKQEDVMNNILEKIVQTAGCPLEFKIMKEDLKSRDLYTEIMTDNKFLSLSNKNSLKTAMYNFMVQKNQFLEEIKEQLDKI